LVEENTKNLRDFLEKKFEDQNKKFVEINNKLALVMSKTCDCHPKEELKDDIARFEAN
jgi:hypothetical protein